MNKFKMLGYTLALCGCFSVTAEASSVKWKDDQGVTHYGEYVPPEYSGKNRVQLDSRGREIKEKVVQPDVNNHADSNSPEQKALVERQRKDRALLSTYSNEKEIDLARDRNLQQVEARINSIQLLQQSAQESLDSFRKEAKAIKAGKPIPASLQADISAAEGKMDKLKLELDAANEKATSVTASFEADKARYRELKGLTKTGEASKGEPKNKGEAEVKNKGDAKK